MSPKDPSQVGIASRYEPASCCTNCGVPGPWLSRVGLVKVLQSRVRASSDLPLSARIELRAVLDRLKSKDHNDTSAIAALRLLRDTAPAIWQESKAILDALSGDAVKKALDLG